MSIVNQIFDPDGFFNEVIFGSSTAQLIAEGFNGFWPSALDIDPLCAKTFFGDMGPAGDYRKIVNPIDHNQLEGLSQDEIDTALNDLYQSMYKHLSNPRFLVANFNGAAIAIRHSRVDAVIVKDVEPTDMTLEASEGMDAQLTIGNAAYRELERAFPNLPEDARANMLDSFSFKMQMRNYRPGNLTIGPHTQADIEHLHNVFTYATGKAPALTGFIIQGAGPQCENPIQGLWHFDREDLESLLEQAVLEGRVPIDQKYVLLKTKRGQSTEFSPQVHSRDVIFGLEDRDQDHDAFSTPLQAESVPRNHILIIKASLVKRALQDMLSNRDVIHRSPTPMRGFARMAYSIGG